MQRAQETLAAGNTRPAGLAERPRYESEASLSCAFKRIIGVAPSIFAGLQPAAREHCHRYENWNQLPGD